MIGTFESARAAKVVVALALLLTAASASAAPDDSTAKAKALYDNGVTDYNLGHYEDALVSFEQGYRIRHDPAFLFNIAQCQRQLRRYEDAERSQSARTGRTSARAPICRQRRASRYRS